MAIDSELDDLLRSGERDRVELKRSPSQGKDIRQAICAFANDLPDHGKPGYLVIGLEDDGACGNLRVDDDLLNNLSNIRGEGNILPIPSIDIDPRSVADCPVVVLTVHPATAPPVKFKGTV